MITLPRWLQTSLAAACAAATSIVPDASQPRPSHSAEAIRILATGPLVFTLSVDDLETFAKTDEITGDLKRYAPFLDKALLAQLRAGLTFKFSFDVVSVGKLAYSPLGRDVLFNLGKVLQVHPGINGPRGLRAAVIGAAASADAEGWTLIDGFVGDGILSYTTVLLEGKAIDAFALLPEFPLTCEFYGLALPNNDPDWQTTVNQFLVSDGENAVAADWFTDLYPATLDQTEFCLNR